MVIEQFLTILTSRERPGVHNEIGMLTVRDNASTLTNRASQRRLLLGRELAVDPVLIAGLFLCLAANALFLIIPHAPLLDVPNHAARLFIECSPGDPFLSRMYTLHFGLIPNLASDILLPPLCRLASPWQLQIGMMVLSQSVIAGCVFVLHRHLYGRYSASLLVTAALSFNLVTLMGYVNFLFGTAMAFAIFTWLVVAAPRSKSLLFLVGTIGGTLIFFAHIFALAFLVLIATGWLWSARGDKLTLRSLVRSGWQASLIFAVPLALVAVAGSGDANHDPLWMGKVRLLMAAFYTGESRSTMFVTVLAAGVLMFLATRRAIQIAPAMRGPLILLAGFVAIVPSAIGEAVDIDTRLGMPLAMLFIAAARFSIPTGPVRTATYGWLAALPISIVAAIALVWIPFSQQIEELEQGFASLPAGAPLLTIISDEDEQPARVGQISLPYWHLASYALIQRQVFNPLQFTASSMQPLQVAGSYRRVSVAVGQPLPDKDADAACKFDGSARQSKLRKAGFSYAVGWCQTFPFVLYLHLGAPKQFGSHALAEVSRGSFFTLFRVTQQTTVTPSTGKF